MEIEIKGKSLNLAYGHYEPGSVKVSLTGLKAQLKPDLTKLKAGDVVWLELKIDDFHENVWFRSLGTVFKKEDVIAHFSTEEKKAELPEGLGNEATKEDLIYAYNQIRDVVKELQEKVK